MKLYYINYDVNGGAGNINLKSMKYNEIEEFKCDESTCLTNSNNKIDEINYKKYTIEVSSGKITLYDENAKYSEFSIDTFEVHFGYLLTMIDMLEKIIYNSKKYFSVLKTKHSILWNDGPRLKKLQNIFLGDFHIY